MHRRCGAVRRPHLLGPRLGGLSLQGPSLGPEAVQSGPGAKRGPRGGDQSLGPGSSGFGPCGACRRAPGATQSGPGAEHCPQRK
eukprot:8080570-Pyramimonas_sp.AAC.1